MMDCTFLFTWQVVPGFFKADTRRYKGEIQGTLYKSIVYKYSVAVQIPSNIFIKRVSYLHKTDRRRVYPM